MPQNTAFMAITISCTLIMGRNGSSANGEAAPVGGKRNKKGRTKGASR